MSLTLTTTQKLQLVTGAAKTIDVTVGWFDGTTPASTETLITTNTTTDICAAPSSGVRDVDYINVCNRDSAACDVTVQKYDSTGTKTTVLRKAFSLLAGYTLSYTHRGAWALFDDSGRPVRLNNIIGSPLSSGKLLIGNGSDRAAEVSMSGDGAMDNAGVFSLLNAVNEISITGATSATIQRMHVCSGTSTDYSVPLPTPSAGKLIGFRMDPALTRLVTLDAGTGKTIDGAQTRVLWTNETCILMGTSSTTWEKIAGKTIPMMCELYANSVSSANNNVQITVTLDGEYYDNTAALAVKMNAGGNQIKCLRAGKYLCSAQATTGNYTDTSNAYIVVGATNKTHAAAYHPSFQAVATEMLLTLSVSDLLTLGFLQASGSNQATGVVNGSNPYNTFMRVLEVPQW